MSTFGNYTNKYNISFSQDTNLIVLALHKISYIVFVLSSLYKSDNIFIAIKIINCICKFYSKFLFLTLFFLILFNNIANLVQKNLYTFL